MFYFEEFYHISRGIMSYCNKETTVLENLHNQNTNNENAYFHGNVG